jgi:hypothetical protein
MHPTIIGFDLAKHVFKCMALTMRATSSFARSSDDLN